MHTLPFRSSLILLLLLIVAAVPSAAQEPDVFDIGEQTEQVADTRSESSFGSQFFISTRFQPGSDEKEIEILGSVLIWFLLLLSAGSIGLIGMMAMTNQTICKKFTDPWPNCNVLKPAPSNCGIVTRPF